MRRINVNGVMTPAMERSIIVTHTVHQVKKNFFWGCINAAILSVIIYDIAYTCPFYSETFRTIELVVAAIFGVNTLYHFARYFLTTIYIQPVVVSPVQKQLLGFKNSDSYVKTSTPVSTANTCSSPISPSTTPINLSACSWLSSPLMSVSDFDDSKLSGNLSMSSPSWLYMSGNTPQKSPVSPVVRRPLSVLNRSTMATSLDIINDEYSLNRYLKEYDGLEKSSVVGKSMEQPSNLLSMFWSHPVARSPSEANPILRRCTYQMAIHAPELATNTTRSSDETGSSLNCDAEVWRTFKINKNNLIQWIANLRMWISQTILERLVCEIKYINAALQANGFVDVCIGEVGLDRLRKTAQIPLVVQNIASLPCLVPFLEVSPNQEYVVSRITELARGGCMSDFKWNSGGAFDGKEWAEHLPTDAALVLHLWATYLDSQLPPLPSMPDGHPFSSLYLIKSPNKPSKVPLAITQVTENPPHYQLVVGDEVHHVPKGRNNLFYTILLFLHQIKTKEHGMLGRMNLGRSGVNMLWVIES